MDDHTLRDLKTLKDKLQDFQKGLGKLTKKLSGHLRAEDSNRTKREKKAIEKKRKK